MTLMHSAKSSTDFLSLMRNLRTEEKLNAFIKKVEDQFKFNKKKEARKSKSKKSDFNKSDFTLRQTGLLILYLKENKVFLNNITDIEIYQCFADLTGFSKEQLKKALSGKPKHDKTELTQRKDDFNKLKGLLTNVVVQIDKDLSKLK